jgi:hypothetical protein
MSGETSHKPEIDEGFALFVVLAFLLMTTAFTTPFLAGARINALVTLNASKFTREKFVLRGLAEMAGVRFFERYQDREFKAAAIVYCPASRPGGPKVNFFFQDHSGLVDLNAASAEVLAIGFESLALKRDTAAILAGEVIRFRSVELGQVSKNERPVPRGGYKHALFESTAELSDLTGAFNIKLADIDRIFTVHSGTGTVDDAAAQGGLLEKLANLQAGDRFFVVNDARRGNAVTVTVNLTDGNHPAIFGSAVLSPAESVGEVRFAGPFSYRQDTAQARSASLEPGLPCGDFFDPVLIDAINEALS